MEEKRNNSKGQFAAGLFAGMAIVIALSIVVVNVAGFLGRTFNTGGVIGTGSKKSAADQARILSKIRSIEALIDKYYIEDIDSDMEAEGIYYGIVDSLGDEYSTYYTASEMQRTLEDNAGKYGGIGCYIAYDTEKEYSYVAGIIPGYSAEQAGLMSGDIFYKVDGESVMGESSETVSNLVRGQEGTTVNITIIRDGEEKDFTLIRRQVEIKSVSGNIADEKAKIGYIQISSFDIATEEQFYDAMDELEGSGIEGLIIDLRDNPGGDVDVATAMASRILPKGLIMYTEDKNGKRDEYNADGKNVFEKPLVIITNGNSASASEIFAGAVKTRGRGIIVGEKTYGKGVVQVVVPMTDGSAVKLTTAKYYLPDGTCIHGEGIEPDVEIELDLDEYLETGKDNQKEKAIEVLKEQMK